MKPNAIVFDGKGVGCIVAPDITNSVIDHHWELRYNKALEAAMKNIVYFKPEDLEMVTTKIQIAGGFLNRLEKGKLYPVPDGYEIEIKEEPSEDSGIDGSGPPYSKVDFESYVVLVPKQETGISDEQVRQEAELSGITSIEEAAKDSFNLELAKETPQKYDDGLLSATKHGYERGFIAGAKYQEAEIETLKYELAETKSINEGYAKKIERLQDELTDKNSTIEELTNPRL